MDVRILFGRYEGQIRDIEPQAARGMLADGRAIYPCAELPAAPALALTPEVQALPPKKRRR